MNTKHAETETSIERINATFERLRTDMAKRDNRLIVTVMGIIMVAGITILGFVLG